jgi:predicted MFS family arabinose efflux permease
MATQRRPANHSPLGEALTWASRIMSVGVAMFLPAAIGGWLDDRLGTDVLAAIGLVLWFLAGLTWLVRMTVGQKHD